MNAPVRTVDLGLPYPSRSTAAAFAGLALALRLAFDEALQPFRRLLDRLSR